MAYLTFNKLNSRSYLSKAGPLNESITSRTYYEKMVFLSYRRKDREWVESIVKLLKSLGVSVYIDYLDETLEDKQSTQVATVLRERIGKCNKFLCLATPNSSESKWMPWELGLGDRIVNYNNVAILPITNNSNSWNDQEYGRIYGHIICNYASIENSSDDWHIIYPDNTKVKLKDWLVK